MSPKIKMKEIHDERDDDIIELSDEELKEILADEDFDNGEEYGEIHSFVFSNPDPYAKVEPRPDDAPTREILLLMKRATSLLRIRLPFGCPRLKSWMR